MLINTRLAQGAVLLCMISLLIWPSHALAAEPSPPEPLHDPRFATIAPGSAMSPMARYAPPTAPWSQPTSNNPNDPGFWTQIRAQGSKWLMDAVIVGAAGSILSATSGVVGLASASVPYLFRTPRHLTVDLSGLPLGSPRGIAQIVARFALAVIVVILTYRLAGLIAAYDHQSAVRLGMQTGLAAVLTWSAWDLCGIMIDIANRLADEVVGAAFGSQIPIFQAPTTVTGGGVSLVYSFAAFLHYAALLILLFQAFRRIIVVNLLLSVSPLIGIAVMTDGGWNYARVWLFRMIEALATPVIWAVALAVAQALITAWVQSGPGDDLMRAVSGMILAAFAYLTIGEAPRAVGIAAAESLIAIRALAVTSTVVQRVAGWAMRR